MDQGGDAEREGPGRGCRERGTREGMQRERDQGGDAEREEPGRRCRDINRSTTKRRATIRSEDCGRR